VCSDDVTAAAALRWPDKLPGGPFGKCLAVPVSAGKGGSISAQRPESACQHLAAAVVVPIVVPIPDPVVVVIVIVIVAESPSAAPSRNNHC
jgi:hypothetical protein